MNPETQKELNDVIARVRKLYPAVQRFVKQDLSTASDVIVSALKGRTPISYKPHKAAKKLVQPGNLKKSMRRLPLRRTKNSVLIGPKFGGANDGFYAPFVNKGTKFQAAQHFVEKAADASGSIAQGIAIKLIIRRVSDYEAANFK